MSPTVNPPSSTTTNAAAAGPCGRTHGPAVATTNARTVAPIRHRPALKGSRLALVTIWDTLLTRQMMSRKKTRLPERRLKAAIFRYRRRLIFRRLERLGNSSLSHSRKNHAVAATELAANQHISLPRPTRLHLPPAYPAYPASLPCPACPACASLPSPAAPISPPIPFDTRHKGLSVSMAAQSRLNTRLLC